MRPINKYGRNLFFVCVAVIVIVGSYQQMNDVVILSNWAAGIILIIGSVAIFMWQSHKKSDDAEKK